MKKYIPLAIFILTFTTILVSCSHQTKEDRSVASQSCWDSVKTEYHSYFDSVEKCIEKQSDK